MFGIAMNFLNSARVLALLILMWVLTTPASAQTFPNHFDPAQREDVPELSAVPSLRILSVTGFPPFSFRLSNGELVGYNIDLAKAICVQLDIVCSLQAWPFEQAADALADNQGDMLMGSIAISDQTVERFDFSHVYLGFPARFVTRQDDVEAFNPRQLDGKTIAVRRGSAQRTFLTAQSPLAVLLELDTEIEALDAVAAGAADAYFGDAMRASFWLNEHLDCCAFAGEAYHRPDLFGKGLAIAFPADLGPVRKAVDWALDRLNRQGQLDELYLRWFPVSYY